VLPFLVKCPILYHISKVLLLLFRLQSTAVDQAWNQFAAEVIEGEIVGSKLQIDDSCGEAEYHNQE
jgi:hypothetical protein